MAKAFSSTSDQISYVQEEEITLRTTSTAARSVGDDTPILHLPMLAMALFSKG